MVWKLVWMLTVPTKGLCVKGLVPYMVLWKAVEPLEGGAWGEVLRPLGVCPQKAVPMRGGYESLGLGLTSPSASQLDM